jgi:hypothetical protein
LTKVRAESGRTMSARGETAKCLYDGQLAADANYLPYSENAGRAGGLIDPPPAQTASNIGKSGSATQRSTHHCAVNVKGEPAKPQYPLRGSDGRGSLGSHRHIMQPDPWHR